VAALRERLRKDIDVEIDYEALNAIEIATEDIPQSP
jgi:hypothetical protein